MISIAKWPRMIVATLLLLFSASFMGCGGGSSGGGSNGEDNPPAPTNLDGVWGGTYSQTDGNKNLAALMYDGEIKILTEDSAIYDGTYSVTDGNFSATIHNSTADVDMTGTASERNQISATYQSTSGNMGDMMLQFDNDLYDRASSLELLAGDWSNTEFNLSINAAGDLTGNSDTCHLSGKFSILDQGHNLYILDADYTDADSTRCERAGQYNGLAILWDADGVRNSGLLWIISNDHARQFSKSYRP